MKKLIGLLVAIVVGLALLPLIITSAEDYDLLEISETFTAESDDATSEDFTVVETIDSTVSVTVEGSALVLTTDYTLSGKVFTLLTDSSNIGDEVVITYIYEMEVATGVDELVSLLPILFTVILVVGIVVTIKIKN